jgi:hypothetical protein
VASTEPWRGSAPGKEGQRGDGPLLPKMTNPLKGRGGAGRPRSNPTLPMALTGPLHEPVHATIYGRWSPGAARQLTTQPGPQPSGRDCCQYCCQDTGQRQSQADNCGMSAQRTDRNGRAWTTCLSLRIRRLGVRIPPSAPPLTRHFPSSRYVRTAPDVPRIARTRRHWRGSGPGERFGPAVCVRPQGLAPAGYTQQNMPSIG